ncbi:glycosyltransferase family 1 protein [Bacteroides nordii]|uniref:glycosyltransferase family 1 protein n=1 Tax=Bacteroides nordii TaxID=291645 RepID=UPI00241CBC11|nr:glycosyltransferase family 1 protein [Bacteroides nordii]MBD9109852.1 glycosyltransferase family 1 protein [Bacteroides nordii]
MKILFLIFHGFDEANGISKKIRYQVKALRECGADVRVCYYDIAPNGHRQWLVNEEVIADLGKGEIAKIKKRVYFKPIYEYAQNESIDLVYIRSFHNANPFTIHLIKQLKTMGARVIMEIPTYPYDQEYVTPGMKVYLTIDRHFRHKLARELDAIITFSDKEKIFGVPTIRISNGIDFDAIPLKQHINDTSHELHLIGVAEVHYWHGFDRLIQGLAEYYLQEQSYKVFFHIVGQLSGERERQEIIPAIYNNGLTPYVILHGARYGKELDELFEQADLGIGSLGRHRSGIDKIKVLKNREYAARGLAFTYSETDEDFDNMPYVWKVPANETSMDIQKLIDFHQSIHLQPIEIRNSIANLSWKHQMQEVINQISLMTTHNA